jgi:hypothetical protein
LTRKDSEEAPAWMQSKGRRVGKEWKAHKLLSAPEIFGSAGILPAFRATIPQMLSGDCPGSQVFHGFWVLANLVMTTRKDTKIVGTNSAIYCKYMT